MNLAAIAETTQHNPHIWHLDDLSTHQAAYNDTLTASRLKTLLNALPAGVVVLDGQGLVNECNPAAIALLGEPLLGESWRSVIDRSFNPMPSGQDVVTNSGRIVNISTCPLGDNLPGQIILLQDVTTNRQLQGQLDQQKRLATMGQMAAQLAHQIRTPIASALLYASHLKKSNLSEQHRLRFADKILSRIQNLENLIKDMLLFSKNGMEQGIDLGIKNLFETIKQSTELNAKTQITFINKCKDDTYIHGNQNLLVSSLLNLIENAEQSVLETSNEYAVIKVEFVERLKGFIDLIVRDNGKGINKNKANKIFEPFYTSKIEGTGLGLAVVKAISHGHRGELWLEKTGTQGSTFVLRLPLQKK